MANRTDMERTLAKSADPFENRGEELQPSVVCPEWLAGEPSPPDGILGIFDLVIRRPPTVVERDRFLCLPRRIHDDEAHAWKQLVGGTLDLGEYRTFPTP